MARGAKTAVLLLVTGCNPNTAGMGTAASPFPNEGSGSTTSDPSDVTSTTAGAEVADGTATDGPVSDSGAPAQGHPEVVISDGPTFDYGAIDLYGPTEHAFVVTNVGDADASSLVVAEIVAPFVITGHDCTATLAAGASCQVQVQFTPDRFGDHLAELALSFDDAGASAGASRMLVGRGVGTTGNLIANPGGELGLAGASPPQDWTIGIGTTWTANASVAPHGGARVFVPGGQTEVTEYVLYQQIHATPLTTWGDAEGLLFHYRVHRRAGVATNDPTSVRLRFGTSNATMFFLHQSDSYDQMAWNRVEHTNISPVGTHYVRLELVCSRAFGVDCNGYFDDIELWVEWAG